MSETTKHQDENNILEESTAHEAGEAAQADQPDQPDAAQELALLRSAIGEKDVQLDTLVQRLQRLQADFENYKRRTQQEKTELTAFVTMDVIARLLPVVDNFERAIMNLNHSDAATMQAGIEMIYRQLSQALEKIGVQPIRCVGLPFNPEEHEAVMRVEADEQEDGTILEELQKGYIVCGKVVRPSMVKVAAKE